MAKQYRQNCPVAKTLEIIGDRWTLLLVRDLLRGPQRFQDFQRSLNGIAPNILSDRLKLLEDTGIIGSSLYSEHPPRAKYELTPKGRQLGWVVGAMAVWGSIHAFPDGPLTHTECGTPVEAGFYCPKCDLRVPDGGLTMPPRAS